MRVRQLLPTWIEGYQRTWLRGDLLAGVTVTAYLIPQVMAYAELAGLPAVAGLWASVGALVGYAAVGSSRLLSVGPESTTALMTAAAIGSVAGASGHAADFATALALVVAGVCLLGWLGRLSAVSELLSRPVLVGYMTGIAVIMIVSQASKLTGITVESEGVFDQLIEVARNIDDVNVPTLLVGLSTLVFMLVGSKALPRAPIVLMGMLGATAVTAALDLQTRGVEVLGEIPTGLPVPGLPEVSVDGVLAMLVPALGVAFVAYTDNILTARAFADRDDPRVDSRREMLALSAANLGSSLMQGFPVSSSGSRTAIVNAVGGRSQLAGLVTALATVLAILTLGPVLSAFPMAALGAVVVYAGIQLIDVAEFRRLAEFRRSEFLIAVATTVSVLVVGVLEGVFVAVGISLLDLLRRVTRPHDAVEGLVPGMAGMHDVDDFPEAEVVPGLVVYRYDSPLFFANAENFRSRAWSALVDSPAPVLWFVLNTEAIVEVDITAVDVLESLRRDLVDQDVVFALARLKQDLRSVLEPTGFLDRIGPDFIFPTLPTTLEAYEQWRTEQDPSQG